MPLGQASGFSRADPGGKGQPPVLTSPNPLSTLHRRFACARLSQPCLPGSDPDVSATLPSRPGEFHSEPLSRVGSRRGGLRMMPTSPRSPLSFRTAGFPQYGWKDGSSDGAFPTRRSAQACSRHALAPYWFASVLRASRSYPRISRSVSGRLRVNAPPWRVGNPPPQGSSLGSGLCCPGPSSLNRPHPPHSQAHRDFTARRLIRDAFAVRERLGDPRVVPGFRCPFFPDMPPSMTPGSSIIVMVQFSDADMAFAEI